MSQDEDICYEERDGIAIVTLNRPAKKNALTDQMVGGVANSVDAATANPDVAPLFCAGLATH